LPERDEELKELTDAKRAYQSVSRGVFELAHYWVCKRHLDRANVTFLCAAWSYGHTIDASVSREIGYRGVSRRHPAPARYTSALSNPESTVLDAYVANFAGSPLIQLNSVTDLW